ncbi:MAG: LPS assembly protein LptD [Oligoflexia bacterium]|nr:LPS assembly protein LptD [Oligoflexia bacterium]
MSSSIFNLSRFGLLRTLFLSQLVLTSAIVSAQVEQPDRKHLYKEDTRSAKRQREKFSKSVLKADKAANDDINVKADQVQFLKDKNEVKAMGGVVLSREGVQAQADDALVNMSTKQSHLSGNVAVAQPSGAINATGGDFNFEYETGTFSDAEFALEDGGYNVEARQADKLSETEYQLKGSTLTTCQCDGGARPWVLHSSRSHITQEGYAHTYNTWMEFHGVPIFYTPYLAFPVKQERQSGLLAPEFGYSGRDGFKFKQPIYLVPNESSDLTVSPFVETRTRVGSVFDYRQSFSKYNKVKGSIIYANEGWRDGELRGTDTSDVFDKTIKENRVGVYWDHLWTNRPDDELNWAFIADVHYINDDLVLRELEDEKIGHYNDRYTTSTILGRVLLGEYGSAEISSEYNQALVSDGDLTFQRLPELNVDLQRSLRPFGFNPYGLKVTPRLQASAVNFSRKEGYDGWRYDLSPGFSMPFHVKNYVNGRLEALTHQTRYSLDQTRLPGTTDTFLDDTSTRQAYVMRASFGSGVERVFELPDDNWLSWLTALGKSNQQNRLVRLKHTIEPTVSYTFVPDTASSTDLPLFDGFDRVRARSLVTYGFRSNLYGRFLPRVAAADSIPELTPKVEDLPVLTSDGSLANLDSSDPLEVARGNLAIRKGEIRPLLSFGMKQSYDYEEDRHDSNASDPKNDLKRTAYSDVNSDLTLYPSSNFALRFENNLDPRSGDFSSWGLSSHIRDDRGDTLRGRYTFIDKNISQLEGNAELALTDLLKLGYYGRFDDREHEFLENRFGLRLQSSCNCWKIDLGVSDKVNPDRKEFTVVFTFAGLGDLAQKFGLGNQSR